MNNQIALNCILQNKVHFFELKSSEYLYYMSPVYGIEKGNCSYIFNQIKVFFRRVGNLLLNCEWLNNKRLFTYLKREENWILNSSIPLKKVYFIALSFLFKEFNKRNSKYKRSHNLTQIIDQLKKMPLTHTFNKASMILPNEMDKEKQTQAVPPEQSQNKLVDSITKAQLYDVACRTKINQAKCSICFKKELPSIQLVYLSCCFNKICDACDKILNKCPHCRTELGELRIRFGFQPIETKNSSKLRLSLENNTVKSIISTLRKFFPLLETQLSNGPIMRLRDFGGRLLPCYGDHEITKEGEYYLGNIRLPHKNITDSEVEGWIMALLVSGKTLTTRALTKEEIHRKCNSYADRISSSGLSQEYINSLLESLMKRSYCELDGKTDTYYYLS